MSPRLEQLLHFLENSPDDAFILFAIAKEYESLSSWEQAKEYYLKLKQTSPDYVGLYYHLGKLYEHFEDLPNALKTYDEGMLVAKQQNDNHSYGELAGAKLLIEE